MVVVGDVGAEDCLTVVNRGVQGLRMRQAADGSWPTPLETDASVTALHILLMHYLSRVDPAIEDEMVRYIRHEQHSLGGWPGFPGGQPLLDTTILCSAALKAAGASATDPALARAEVAIHRLGGVSRASLRVRAFLVLLGLAPLESVPHISSQLLQVMMWFHPRFRDHDIFAMVVVPFALLIGRSNHRTFRRRRKTAQPATESNGWRLADGGRPSARDGNRFITESSVARAGRLQGGGKGRVADIGRAFAASLAASAVSAASRLLQQLVPGSKADEAAWSWIAERQGRDKTFGEVFWPTMLSLMALDDEPSGRYTKIVSDGLEALNRWPVRDERGAWQPFTHGTTCMTALALVTLVETGAPGDDPAVDQALRWLLDHQASAGAGAIANGQACHGAGWYFGASNDLFPDVDDTTIVLQGLLPFRHRCEEAFRRGVEWLLAMEHRRGGWASFSNDGSGARLAALGLLAPEMADQPDEDITARVLFLLAQLRGGGLDRDLGVSSAVDRGVEFLWRRMRPDGTWCGHWMVNHVYGTAQVLEALARCGIAPGDARIERSTAWLESVQNSDGGWGESKDSYALGRYEPGPSNPLITSAAVMALVALGRGRSGEVSRAIDYLVSAREADGLWYDRSWSGVVFPGMSYTAYNLAATCGAIVSIHRALRVRAEI